MLDYWYSVIEHICTSYTKCRRCTNCQRQEWPDGVRAPEYPSYPRPCHLGATGLVGTGALNHILNLPTGEVSRLFILSRSPVPMAENKPNVTVIEHKNFNEYSPELLEQLRGADGCIWAQGISTTQVSKEEYQKITYDYPLAAAKAFSTLSSSFNFVYVSGEGATQTPGLFTPLFGRVKGEAETALLALSKENPSLKPFSVRPAYVDPTRDPETFKAIKKRPDHQTLVKKSVYGFIGPVLKTAWPSFASPTDYLGKFLTDLAKGDGEPLQGTGVSGEGRILNNAAFRREVGL